MNYDVVASRAGSHNKIIRPSHMDAAAGGRRVEEDSSPYQHRNGGYEVLRKRTHRRVLI